MRSRRPPRRPGSAPRNTPPHRIDRSPRFHRRGLFLHDRWKLANTPPGAPETTFRGARCRTPPGRYARFSTVHERYRTHCGCLTFLPRRGAGLSSRWRTRYVLAGRLGGEEASEAVDGLPEAGHRIGVHVLTVSEGQAAMGALYLEPKPLVEGHRGRVVHVDAKLDARQVQPVVCQIERRSHQRRPDSLALPVVAHGHPHAADVPHARAVWGGLQAEVSDYLSIHASHQQEQPFRWLGEPLAPSLGRLQ